MDERWTHGTHKVKQWRSWGEMRKRGKPATRCVDDMKRTAGFAWMNVAYQTKGL